MTKLPGVIAIAMAFLGCVENSSSTHHSTGGSPAAVGGGTEGGAPGQGEGGELPIAGTDGASVVNHCECAKGAMPPPECQGVPVVGARCDEEEFAICRVGFVACYYCFGVSVPGCTSSE